MAKCKKCGKSGLFLKIDSNGLCSSCASERDAFYKKLEDDRRRHEAEMARLNAIHQRLHSADDFPLPEKIAFYERFVDDDEEPGYTRGAKYQLVQMYRAVGQNDRAWGMLNGIYLDALKKLSETGDEGEFNGAAAKVRWQQHEILLDEGKHVQAVHSLAAYYLLNNLQVYGMYKPETFVRRAGPIARKGGMTTDQVRELAQYIEYLIQQHCGDEQYINQWFSENRPK